ncbi:hypothetical protein COF68_16815 [Bacillus toyonensis]|uniref:putative phage abortive infection protein n=1 Tax=Bacillus toyonensis TaxID=155322 RepID=UPI000BFB5B1B|nr:putative phage abortive infection protein [Bacillus toyonensis]PHA81004.1 hypothetical protein COE77_29185 [Bacillus toyonensis]PHE61386.1 hypothetical protein COF68_16815 [Bacillus toyonensis]PHF22193.1 hypothetical protein COF79_24590 [Bacillus toyonensis]
MWKLFGKNSEANLIINILRGCALLFVVISFIAPWMAKSLVYDKLDTRDAEGKVIEMIFSEKIGSLGTVGDWLGGSTLPWLTFATTFLLIETSIMQRKQLRLQRQEMKENTRMQVEQISLQKAEMEKTNEEFVLQNKTLSTQRFETTFFNMLSLHNELVDKIIITQDDVGRAAFHKTLKIFFDSYKKIKRETDYSYILLSKELNEDKSKLKELVEILNFKESILEEKVNIPDNRVLLYKQYIKKYPNELVIIFWSYNIFFKDYHDNIGNYFKSLYRIIKYVDETNLIEEQGEKEFYTDFIRAQMSSYEQIFLFYNCISEKGFVNFLPLLFKYKLLDGMDNHLLFDQEHIKLYEKYAVYPLDKDKREKYLESMMGDKKLFIKIYREKVDFLQNKF